MKTVARAAFLGALVLGVVFGPRAAQTQEMAKVYRIGYLAPGDPGTSTPMGDAFRQGLRELGWIEGRNVAIEYRWAEGDLDRLPALASELVKTRVDVIVAGAGLLSVRAARQASPAVPIVAFMSDPVAHGFAVSLARPGGTVTGVAAQLEDVVTKQLQILKDAVPKLTRVTTLADHQNPVTRKAAEAAVRALGLRGRVLDVHDVSAPEGAFRTAKAERAGALHVLPSPAFQRQRARLAELAVKYRLPAMYENKLYVEAGGLMSYGPSYPEAFWRLASYVDRIFKGAKPGDLPIEQPTKFELVINLKTAKALGLTIPPSVLLQADQVLE